MRILLTNDDGYDAPGLRALHDGLVEAGHDVIVAAPDREKSAASLSITLRDPLRAFPIEPTGMRGWAINGTPADCVKLAVSELLKTDSPDIVFSGINRGSNIGLNANYSGTVAGAIEGAMNGLPGVAMSLMSYTSEDYSATVAVASYVLDKVIEEGLSTREVLNVNVPAVPLAELKGVRVAPVSHVVYREVVDKRQDAHGRDYYWLGGTWAQLADTDGGDDQATRAGYAAVTPLQIDWTARVSLDRMRGNGWNQDWVGGIPQ